MRRTTTGMAGADCPCGMRIPPHSTHECTDDALAAMTAERDQALNAMENLARKLTEAEQERDAYAETARSLSEERADLINNLPPM